MFEETEVALTVPKLDGSSNDPTDDDPTFSDDMVIALEGEDGDA
jgi:hypothetical protein